MSQFPAGKKHRLARQVQQYPQTEKNHSSFELLAKQPRNHAGLLWGCEVTQGGTSRRLESADPAQVVGHIHIAASSAHVATHMASGICGDERVGVAQLHP